MESFPLKIKKMDLLKYFKRKKKIPDSQTEEIKKRHKYKMEVKNNITIEINKELNEKINWFTHNYEKEINGFLVGEMTKDKIYIEDILFPRQDVSSASADTLRKDLVKLRKEYGDRCLKIIGHWHSHVKMGTFWSQDDEDFMAQYGNPRPKTIFIVSSDGDQHKVRLKLMEPFDISIDDLDYSVEDKNNELSDELKKVIEEKVVETEPEKESIYTGGYNPNWQDTNFNINGKSNFNEDDILTTERIDEIVFIHKNNVIVKELTENQYNELEQVYANVKHSEWNGSVGKMIYECTSQNQAEVFVEELKEYLNETFVDLEIVEEDNEEDIEKRPHYAQRDLQDDDYWQEQEEKQRRGQD